jgi:hypothetical protein
MKIFSSKDRRNRFPKAITQSSAQLLDEGDHQPEKDFTIVNGVISVVYAFREQRPGIILFQTSSRPLIVARPAGFLYKIMLG